tara:strand:+ start:249 stop:629 length:381 start_codon:yes stop_codon:yes gene_type:complete
MKTIKITLLCLFISVLSYSQDTIWVMVNGTNMHYFSKNMKIIKSTDHYNDYDYKDYKITIKKNQILVLDLYDSCKYCKRKYINYRDLLIEGRVFDEVIKKSYPSSDNTYYIDGSKIKSITVLKPNE